MSSAHTATGFRVSAKRSERAGRTSTANLPKHQSAMVINTKVLDDLFINEHGDADAETARAVRDMCIERNTTFPGESYILSPLLISRVQMSRAASDLACLIKLIEKVPDRLFGGPSPAFFNELGCSAATRHYLESTWRAPAREIICRFDMYISSKGFQVLELNVGPWVGGLCLYRMLGAMEEVPRLERMLQRNRAVCRDTFSNAIETIAAACRKRCVRTLAFVEDESTWDHSLAIVEEALARLTALGLETVHVRPSELRVDRTSGRLYADGKQLDGICRLFPRAAVARAAKAYKPLLTAIQSGSVVDIMYSESWVVGNKGMLAILWRRRFSPALSEEERRVIANYLPPTWLLSNETVEKRRVFARKDHFVLKPVYGFGGEGIVCGWEQSESEWVRSVAKALRSRERYILQKRVNSRKFDLTFYSPSNELTKRRNCSAVVGMFMIGGRFSGAYIRAADTKGVINVANGAAVGVICETMRSGKKRKFPLALRSPPLR
jgi:glutathionylspermidine synthase